MEKKFYDKFYKHQKTEKKSGEKKETKKVGLGSSTKDRGPSRASGTAVSRSGTAGTHPRNASSHSTTAAFTRLESLFDTSHLSADSISVLNNFDKIIQGIRPLNSRQLQQLPDNIKALSHQLTDQRADRRLGYMNDNIQLSSYIRYYTWWNLVRLTRLFSNLPDSVFPKKDGICLDLGSGPLTVVIALWLARPELRNLKLTWYCLDVSANSMALGEDVFLSVAARFEGVEPWHIIRVKGPFGTSIKQKADFITCANMFNELDQAGDMPPEYQTKKYYDQLKTYSAADANLLLIEPGVPKASRTLSLLRGRFLSNGKKVLAPCPHAAECPMNGFKAYTGSSNKWCNFAFSTEDAPAKLQKLSEAAKLPKERATLSFMAVSSSATNQQAQTHADIKLRIASDPFRLPEYKTGHYACSEIGLVLVREKVLHQNAAPLPPATQLHSGDLISVKTKRPDSLPIDEKSGALIIDL